MVTRLVNSGSHVSAVQYVDADGMTRTARADAFVLAASAIYQPQPTTFRYLSP
jgi:hypothetical protein